MLFAVYCIDKPDHAEVRAANRQAHIAYLRDNLQTIRLAGPLLREDGTGMIGSLLLLDLPDGPAVEVFLREDPYARAGLFSEVRVSPFRQVLPEG